MKEKYLIMIKMSDNEDSVLSIINGKIYRKQKYDLYCPKISHFPSRRMLYLEKKWTLYRIKKSMNLPTIRVSFRKNTPFKFQISSAFLRTHEFERICGVEKCFDDHVTLISPYQILRWSLRHKTATQDLIHKYGFNWESISSAMEHKMPREICEKILKYSEDFLRESRVTLNKKIVFEVK